MADAKIAWNTPKVARRVLSSNELETLFPQLGETDRRRFLEQHGRLAGKQRPD